MDTEPPCTGFKTKEALGYKLPSTVFGTSYLKQLERGDASERKHTARERTEEGREMCSWNRLLAPMLLKDFPRGVSSRRCKQPSLRTE